MKQITLFPLLIVLSLFLVSYSSNQLIADYRVSNSINDKTAQLNKQLKIFEKYYHSNQENPQFLFNYALSLIKAKQYQEATKKLTTAKQYSSYYQIYFVSAGCFELMGKTNEAEQDYLRSSALYPSMYQPKYALFRMYLRLNNYEKAKAIAIQIDQMPVKVNSPKIEKIKSEVKNFLLNKIHSL